MNGTQYKIGYRLFMQGFSEDYITENMQTLLTLRRLAKKHHKLAEYDCNGIGWIRGQAYYTGMSYGETPDEYERREYGYSVKSAYLSPDSEESIFDIESDKVADKIRALAEKCALRVEFQGDPRGYTVKFYDRTNRFVDLQD